MPAIACTDEQLELGEGVRWDARTGELLWVDILAGRVFRASVLPDGGLSPVRDYRVGTTVGAVAPITGDDGWLVAAGRGFARLSPDGSVSTVVGDVAPPGSRMNDAACDPQGRCWAGSLADDHREGAGMLHRLGTDGTVQTVLEGLTIPNGMGWSPDGGTMYLIDSVPRTLRAFDFEGGSGGISNGRVLLELPADVGGPDGMAVDAQGHLWIAVYGGAQVRHHAPDGELVAVHPVPAAQSTCCAFAGPGLQHLYVTTATEFFTDAQRRGHPEAGLVYLLEPGAVGVAAAPFAPEPRWWASVVG